MSSDTNKLYYGDNLEVLRRYIPDQSVDLVYLDPPFNSRQDYNVLFAEKDGNRSAAQITAFKDTWEWNHEAELSYIEVVEAGGRVADALRAFRTLLGGSDMLAYLAMMAPRLVELCRVLKETGSIYLHCDPTASHYLKLLMDAVFGPEHFQNEVIWKRTSAHVNPKRWGPVHDVILFSSKSPAKTWNRTFQSYEAEYLAVKYRNSDIRGTYRLTDLTGAGTTKGTSGLPWRGNDPSKTGRHWALSNSVMNELAEEGTLRDLSTQQKLDLLDEAGYIYWTPRGKGGGAGFPQLKRYLRDGVPVQDVITDIPPINSQAQERLGYPTQKPESLLERILKASSNEGDVVLDPFCGCGTTVQVAQRLNRRWIGIDITHLAIGLIKYRLDNSFSPEIRKAYQVIGEPTDLEGARQLAEENKYQFQNWALGLCGARRTGEIKKGADRGIDGRIPFREANSLEFKEIIFSVKGGQNVSVSEVRDLMGVVQREDAAMGIYISIMEPTKPMLKEAAEAGFYTSKDGSRYPKIQLLTIEGLMNGTQRLLRPWHVEDLTFKKAPRSRPAPAKSLTLQLSGSEEID